MSHVATLIPASPVIPPFLLNQCLALLEEAGYMPLALDWLEPRRVVDIYLPPAVPAALLDEMRSICHLFTADLIIQAVSQRDKRMLISDMDSTIITVECIDELADYVGKKELVARITERAMNGELDFTQALNERVALLAGLPQATLQACYDERVKIMPGAVELLAVMKQHGAFCLLVSGGFDFFTSRIAAVLGFDGDVSNRLEVSNGVLTGNVLPPIMDKDGKLRVMRQSAAERGIKPEEILAVGDGANDLPMLQAAGLGVAYHAKPSVRQQASCQVDYNNLTALLYAQGYSPARPASAV